MDTTTKAIVAFAQAMRLSELSDRCRVAAKDRILDTYACAWGGVDAPTVAAARRALLTAENPGPAHLITREVGSAEVAGFINSLMSRYLDFNDADELAYGHPSDMILPLFNVGEVSGASGADVLVAVVAAYQVAQSITLAGGVDYKRWETAFPQGIGTAVGAAMLLRLEPEQIADAVGIAVACSQPLNIRKTGARLSMWKGAGGPQASRMGIEAAWLARGGMQGPREAFEGARGVFEMITGEFDLGPWLASPDPWRVERTTIKLHPTAGTSSAPVENALRLRPDIGDLDDIEIIDIDTFGYLYEFEQKDHASLVTDTSRPGTREMADHSVRWNVAVALIDRDVTPESYRPHNVARTDVGPIVAKMRLREDPGFTARWPQEWVNRITIRMRDGRTLTSELNYPTGSPHRPASRAQLEHKLAMLMDRHLGAANVRTLIDRVDVIEQWADPSELFSYADPPAGAER